MDFPSEKELPKDLYLGVTKAKPPLRKLNFVVNCSMGSRRKVVRDGKTMGVSGHDQGRGDKSQSLSSDWRNGEGWS